jgi:hypothetical protein
MIVCVYFVMWIAWLMVGVKWLVDQGCLWTVFYSLPPCFCENWLRRYICKVKCFYVVRYGACNCKLSLMLVYTRLGNRLDN